MKFATVDFETKAIDGNPILKPPVAVGVAVEVTGDLPANYRGWGHPTKNNSSFSDGCDLLHRVLVSGLPLIFHHANFDLSVWAAMHPFFAAELAKMSWQRVHDTEYLIFFQNPYSNNLALKPSAERILGIPPTEQNELRDWIIGNIPGATSKNFGAYISEAPGDLVGRYATGDVTRTTQLFLKLIEQISQMGMGEAYDRERKLAPIMRAATFRGVRLDRERLESDTVMYTRALNDTEDQLVKILGVEDLSDEEAFKDGLERIGAVKEWVLTPKSGKRSTAQGNLRIQIPELRTLIEYRGALKTCLQTFMRPWLEFSREDGRIHPNWNQVRQRGEDFKGKGARTGRLSSDSPSFMNVPTEWEYSDGSPMRVPPGMPDFPLVRSYCLPEKRHRWLKRDFNSQEFRFVGHFENGAIAEAFRSNPNMDPHQLATDLLASVANLKLSRRPVKITGFSIVYGTGYTGLSSQLGVGYEAAKVVKDAYLKVFPGVRNQMVESQEAGRSGAGIRTIGGRVYFAEPSRVKQTVSEFGCVLEERQDFYYKLLNYKIQGSAADQTKDCINDWNDSRRSETYLLATVHDEINISAPEESWQQDMAHLCKIMEKQRLGISVPIRTEGLVGHNWSDMEKCD